MPRFDRNNTSGRGNTRSSASSTTRLAQFYPNEDNNCASTLSLSLWKNYVIFSLAYELPDEEKTENNVYDYDNSIQVMLSASQIIAIKKSINLIRKDQSAKKSDYFNVAVPCKDDLVLKISTGKEYKQKNWSVSIIDNAAKTKDKISYVFNWSHIDQTVWHNFNEKEGAGDEKVWKTVEFERFLQVLDCALEGLTSAHSNGAISYINNALNRIMSALDVIKGMLESVFSNKGRYSGSSDNGSSSSNRPGSRFASRSGSIGSRSSSGSRVKSKKPASLDEDDDETTDVEDASYDEIAGVLADDDDDE